MNAAARAVSIRGAFQRDFMHVFLLVVFDSFAMFEAFNLAFAIRIGDAKPLAEPMTAGQFGVLLAAVAPLWVAMFATAGLYSVDQRLGRASELGRIVVVVSVGAMLLICVDYFMVSRVIFPARAVPLYGIPLAATFVFGCRLLARALMHVAQRRGLGLRQVVLVGTGALAQHLVTELQRRSSGYHLVAIVDPVHDGAQAPGEVPVFSTLEQALDSRDWLVDEVIQAEADLDRGDLTRMMSETTSRGITYRFVPDQYGIYAAASSLGTLGGIPVMDVRLTSLDGWGAMAKRAFDLIGAVVLLTVLAPVFVAIAAAVKLSDPSGPVFYRHQRLGRGGVSIWIWKFRTMYWRYSTGPGRPYRTPLEAFRAMEREDLCAEFERDQKVQADPRITPVGRVLRRLSLDELPQLLLVVTGRLSLVGPRPITAGELERYGTQRASFLALKPGVTGLWQVSGRNDVSYDERVKLDVYYVENWSMKLDVTILAKTTTAVLAKRGAY